jgi:hypothetical protein
MGEIVVELGKENRGWIGKGEAVVGLGRERPWFDWEGRGRGGIGKGDFVAELGKEIPWLD